MLLNAERYGSFVVFPLFLLLTFSFCCVLVHSHLSIMYYFKGTKMYNEIHDSQPFLSCENTSAL